MDGRVTDVLVGIEYLSERVEALERRLRERHPKAWVTLSLRRLPSAKWSASAYGEGLGVLRADAVDPVAALDGLASIIARRFGSDDAIARTLGIGEAA